MLEDVLMEKNADIHIKNIDTLKVEQQISRNFKRKINY